MEALLTAYVLAQISIHDPARYARYQAGFMPVLLKYGGRLMVADEHPQRLQGAWAFDKVILIAFQDAECATRWLTSPEYEAISEDREAATLGVGLLLAGVDSVQPDAEQ
jgi:uncharacterized protein (DUF1330 family)